MKYFAGYLRAAAAFFILTVLSLSCHAANAPSLFFNDEAWYKDNVSPLVMRGETCYVPAELFGMLDGIEVSVYNEDNILIANTETGKYISVLFQQSSAAVNGKTIEKTGIFRDNGVFYIELDSVSDAVGIEYEMLTADNGHIAVRIYDTEQRMSSEALLKSYSEEGETADTYTPNRSENDETDTRKTIYLLCREADDRAYSNAVTLLKNADMRYTMFIGENASPTEIISLSAFGAYGIALSDSDVEGLNKINENCRKITRQLTHYTLAGDNSDEYTKLTDAGYIPVIPDVTVSISVNANESFREITDRLSENGACTVLLENCWQSEYIISLIAGLDYDEYITANLSD